MIFFTREYSQQQCVSALDACQQVFQVVFFEVVCKTDTCSRSVTWPMLMFLTTNGTLAAQLKFTIPFLWYFGYSANYCGLGHFTGDSMVLKVFQKI